jgi:RNA polymerase sigma-70 factor (family 1)
VKLSVDILVLLLSPLDTVAIINFIEQEHLAALRKGDRSAFSVIYNQYWFLLYESAYKRLQDSDQAEDVVQDVLVALWDSRENLEVQNLRAYLLTAVRYQIFNLIAKDKVKDSYYRYILDQENEYSSSDSELIYNELSEGVQLLLSKMPKKRKEIFELRFQQDLSTATIARKLNLTQKTVQNQLTKAVSFLKSVLASFVLILPFS